MSQTKIYGVDGKREAVMMIPLGNGRNEIQVTFKRGNDLRGANYRPATYACANRIEQLMIESSALFKTGVIRLIKVIGTAETVTETKKRNNRNGGRATGSDSKSNSQTTGNNNDAPNPTGSNDNNADAGGNTTLTPNADGVTEIPEVTTIEEARVALKARGANAGVLMNKSAMKNYMVANKIKFPNFNFEEKEND